MDKFKNESLELVQPRQKLFFLLQKFSSFPFRINNLFVERKSYPFGEEEIFFGIPNHLSSKKLLCPPLNFFLSVRSLFNSFDPLFSYTAQIFFYFVHIVGVFLLRAHKMMGKPA